MKLNLLSLNQEMNIQQFKEENSKLKDEIKSLKPEPRDEHPAIQRRELQTQR
jgi:hypothetical protein